MNAPGASVPTLRWLTELGWCFLPRADALALRGGVREVILKPRLIEVLRTRHFDYKGERHPLSPGGIDQVVREVQSLHLGEGLLAANERLYRLLTLGVTVTEFMPDGKKHQPTIPLIDWQHPAANLWDAAESPELLSTQGTHLRQPDVLGYVNGLPLVVIEARRAGDFTAEPTADEAIHRHLRHQRHDEIPQLFVYAQLLLALGASEARYGTTGTPPKFWARWREEPGAGRDDTPEDTVRALLRPERLLELVRHFVLFDRRLGKVVARPHQFFGVRAMLQRIQQRRSDGARQGGVLWHTTGSGKSLTMVFLTKALVLNPATRACRVLVVTDRIDLEDQLARNFLHGGAFGSAVAARKEGEKARAGSGRDLARRIGHGSERIVFTLIHKFATAARMSECYNPSADVVVLVDEGHRSHGGLMHERLRKALPRAACLAFTGTPLLRDEKTTHRFGTIVHAYPLQRAVSDGTVAPLLYEERVPELAIDNEDKINRWFDRLAADLTPERSTALRRQLASTRSVLGATQRIELIAWDIAQHFHRTIRPLGLGFKGQVATASQLDAIRYHRCLNATGLVSSAVIMSAPGHREGDADVEAGQLPELRAWWDENVGRHADAYEARVLREFASDGAPDLLIVVDRLLTGFDEPRNAVLYIDKPLKEHTLIQAVARVNRLHEGKRHGLLVDYRGILKALDTAVRDYQNLEARTQGGYDIADIDGLYRAVDTEYQRLPGLHAALCSLLGDARERGDIESCRQILMPRFIDDECGRPFDTRQRLRDDFQAALAQFEQCLQIVSSSCAALDSASRQDIALWQDELRFFIAVRQAARRDAQQGLAPAPQERRYRPLLDEHVAGLAVREPEAVYEVVPMDPPERWNDDKARNEADLVRTRLKKAIEVDLGEDPYAQRMFSDLLKQTIADAQARFDRPIEQYLMLRRFEERVAGRVVDGIPEALAQRPHARAYHGICRLVMGDDAFARTPPDTWVQQALAIDAAVNQALVEHSLNPQNCDAAIRQALLPGLFALMGLEKAREAVERVVQVTRVGRDRGAR